MPSVFIPHTGHEWPCVEKMFLNAGWSLGHEDHADLLCLTGGSDISPHLYDQKPHPLTFSDPKRDAEESYWFDYFEHRPIVGICRGGQFLNVMSGGSMEQHIEGHRNCIHEVYVDHLDYPLWLNSDHHQAMWPKENASVIAAVLSQGSLDNDIQEVIYYEHTKSLCFQPHPEWGHEPTRAYFFELLQRFFSLSGDQ